MSSYIQVNILANAKIFYLIKIFVWNIGTAVLKKTITVYKLNRYIVHSK